MINIIIFGCNWLSLFMQHKRSFHSFLFYAITILLIYNMRNSNHLTERLYRNLQGRQRPKQGSPEMTEQPPRQLIPKVALKHQLEPLQLDVECIVIEQRLVEPPLLRANIPTQSHRIYQAMRGQSPVTRQKLPSIYNPSEAIGSQTVKVVRFSKQKRAGSETSMFVAYKRRDLQAPNKLLSPLDFIALLKKDPDMQEEFCYLNKHDNPYDWRIVEFEKRNNKEYMTISARGITKFLNGEVEFQNLDDFVRERATYNRLQQIDFFKTYKKWKTFRVWKRLMRTNIMRECARVISSKLFYLDRTLRKPLLEIRGMCCKLEQFQFFEHRFTNAVKLSEFQEIGEEYRQTVLERKLESTDTQIKYVLSSSCSESFDIFKEENRITHKGMEEHDVDPKKQLTQLLAQKQSQDNQSIIIGDDSNLMMPYTQEATIKTHFVRLRGFIKLTDCLLIDAKLQLCRNASFGLLESLQKLNTALLSETHVFGHVCWLRSEAVLDPYSEIEYDPARPATLQAIERVVTNGVKKICDLHVDCMHMTNLQHYLNPIKGDNIQSQNSEIFNTLQQDLVIQDTSNMLQEEVNKGFDQLVQSGQYLQMLLDIIRRHSIIQSSQAQLSKQDSEELRQLLTCIRKEDEEVATMIEQQDIGLFQLDCSDIKHRTKRVISDTNAMLNDFLPMLGEQRGTEFCALIEELYQRIFISPSNLKVFVKFQRNYLDIKNRFEDLAFQSHDIMNLGELMTEFRIRLTDGCKEKVLLSQKVFSQLRKILDETTNQYPNMIERFKRELAKIIPIFEEKVRVLQEQLKNSEISRSSARVDQMYQFVVGVRRQMDQLHQDQLDIEEYQVALTLESHNFTELSSFQQLFLKYEGLWSTLRQWLIRVDDWQREHFLDLDLKRIRTFVELSVTHAQQFKRELDSVEVSVYFARETEDFLKVVEACQFIRNGVIGPKQWDQIRQAFIGWWSKAPATEPSIAEHLPKLFTTLENPLYTLKYLQSLGLVNLRNELQEICSRAMQENELQQQIQTVETFWRTNSLMITSYKDTKDLILGNNDELLQKVDDHLLTVNNLIASKFVDPIRPRVEHQLRLLKFFQELMEEWTLHQRNWIYLEPILNSSYAQKNLAKENKLFVAADQQWKKMMKIAKDVPHAKKWVDDFLPRNYYTLLKQNNLSFDQIRKSLEEMMEKKREVFQRFYFISNDELLEILSTCKSAALMQPYLLKMFQSVKSLRFLKDQASALISSDGEETQLKNCHLRGEVEDWFKAIEESMRVSMKSQMRQALLRFENDDLKRTEWLQENPQQVVLTISNVLFCRIVEDLLTSGQSESDLSDLYDQQLAQISDLQEYIRSNPKHRRVAQQLLITDLYRRDQVEQMIAVPFGSSQDFKWLSLVRFYWEDEHLFARFLKSKLHYGYEFQGAAEPMIITPPTERVMHAVCQAMNARWATNLWGQEGTGKSELVKELGRQLGKYCLSTTVCDQLVYSSLEKLLIGASYTGTWLCFDKLDQLKPRNLQFFARAVISIYEGLAIEKAEIVINGQQLLLNQQMSIFVTTRMPVHITSFRPIAMIPCDTAYLIESVLQSVDMPQYQIKARRLATFLRVLEDSTDWRMSLGLLKQILTRLDSSENTIVKALRDVLYANLSGRDLQTFEQIQQDIYPTLSISRAEYGGLVNVAQRLFDQQCIGYQDMEKVLLANAMLMEGRVPTILGALGKSTFCRVVQGLLEHNFRVLGKLDSKFSVYHINMASYPEAFGTELAPGLLQTILVQETNLNEDQQPQQVDPDMLSKFIIIENGCIEAMSSLYDTKSISLTNGLRVFIEQLPSRIMLEEESIMHVSPSLASKLNLICLNQPPPIEDYISNQVQVLKSFLDEDQLQAIQSTLVEAQKKFLSFFKKHCSPLARHSPHQLVSSSVHLMRAVLENETTGNIKNAGQQRKGAQRFALWAICNMFSFQLDVPEKGKLEILINEAFQQETARGHLCTSQFSWSKPEGELVLWSTVFSLTQLEDEQQHPPTDYVTTVENTQIAWIVRGLQSVRAPILFVGSSGTGKSAFLRSRPERNNRACTYFCRSRSPAFLQQQLEQRMQLQRRNKRLVMTPSPNKTLLVEIDNVHLGDANTLESLRAILNRSGVFDRKTHLWKEIESTSFIAVTSQTVPERLLHYFSVISISEPVEMASIMQPYFLVKKNDFQREVRETLASVVGCTVAMFKEVRESFQPTPSQPHVGFTMHHVVQVLKGITTTISPNNVASNADLARLWIHQTSRVFLDRVQDKRLSSIILSHANSFGVELPYGEVFEGVVPLAYFLERQDRGSDFVRQNEQFPNRIPNPNGMMLFRTVLDQVCRVSHALFQQRSMVLVGLDGCGRRNVVRMAAGMAGFTMCECAGSLAESLSRVVERICIANEKIVYVVDPSEEMLPILSCIIEYGDLGALLERDDLDQLYGKIQANTDKTIQPQELLLKRIKTNLCFAIIITPHVSRLQRVLVQNAQLTNICLIILFDEWTQANYRQVAAREIQVEPPENLDKYITHIYRNLIPSVPSCCYRSFLAITRTFTNVYNDQRHSLQKQCSMLSAAIERVTESRGQLETLKKTEQDEREAIDAAQVQVEKDLKAYDTYQILANELAESSRVTIQKSTELQEKLDQAKTMVELSNKQVTDCMSGITSQLGVLLPEEVQRMPETAPIHIYQQFIAAIFDVEETEAMFWFIDASIVNRLQNYSFRFSKVDLQRLKMLLQMQSDFTPTSMQRISKAAFLLCEWIHDSLMAFEISAEANKKFLLLKNIEMESLAASKLAKESKAKADAVMKQAKDSEAAFKAAKQDLEKREYRLKQLAQLQGHAETLLRNLNSVGMLWQRQLLETVDQVRQLQGSIILRSFQLALFGGVSPQERQSIYLLANRERLMGCVKADLRNSSFLYNEAFQMSQLEMLHLDNQQYRCAALLIIDRQDSFIEFLEENLTTVVVVNENAPNVMNVLRGVMQAGQTLVIKVNSIQSLEQLRWRSLILQEFVDSTHIQFGDDLYVYHEMFRLFFLSDELEVSEKVLKLIEVQHFQLTDAQMEHNILNLILQIEKPDLHDRKLRLRETLSLNQNSQHIIQQQLLEQLSSLSMPLIDSPDAVKKLEATSEELSKLNKDVEHDEVEFEGLQALGGSYTGVAVRVNVAIRCFEQLCNLDYRYVYSPRLIERVLTRTLQREIRGRDGRDGERSWILVNSVTESIFVHMMVSVEPRFRKALSFILTSQIDLRNRSITPLQYQYLLKGAGSLENHQLLNQQIAPNPPPGITEEQWQAVAKLHFLSPLFDELHTEVTKNCKEWEAWINDTGGWPQSMHEKLPPFERLILVRALKPEKLNTAMQAYVRDRMGNRFSQLLVSKLDDFQEGPDTPTIYFASLEQDPLPNLLKLGLVAHPFQVKSERVHVYSGEYGSGKPISEKEVEDAIRQSHWIILLNFSQSSPPFFNMMQEYMEQLIYIHNCKAQRRTYQREIGPNFQFIIIEYTNTETIPFFLLSNSTKIFYEPPIGVKQIMYKIYSEYTNKKLDDCTKPKPWRKLLFSISFMHSILTDRRRFLSSAWTQPYVFSEQQLDLSVTMLRMAIENSTEIPFEQLNQLMFDTVYLLQSELDKKYISILMERCNNEHTLSDEYKFFETLPYKSVPSGNQMWYLEMINRFPDQDDPEMFGMYGAIVNEQDHLESHFFMDLIYRINERKANTSENQMYPMDLIRSKPHLLEDVLKQVEDRLPAPIKLIDITFKYSKVTSTGQQNRFYEMKKVSAIQRKTLVALATTKPIDSYFDPMELFLNQEATKYNTFIEEVRQLIETVRGPLTLTNIATMQQLLNNQIPEQLQKYIFVTAANTLSGLLSELQSNTDELRLYFTPERLRTMNLGLFYYPKGVLNSLILQLNRKFRFPAENLAIHSEITKFADTGHISHPPGDGSLFISGLNCVNCRWEWDRGKLGDLVGKVHVNKSPLVFLTVLEDTQVQDNPIPVYQSRSWNDAKEPIFIIDCLSDQDHEFWIQRSASFVLK